MLSSTSGQRQNWFIHEDVAIPNSSITKIMVIDGNTLDQNLNLRIFTGTTEALFSFTSAKELNETLNSIGLSYTPVGIRQGF